MFFTEKYWKYNDRSVIVIVDCYLIATIEDYTSFTCILNLFQWSVPKISADTCGISQNDRQGGSSTVLQEI